MIASVLLLAAIRLAGVTGGSLTTRAYFDVNNCKVGDPLVLTIDFVGEADFRELHPPALSKAVNSKDWKVDDASAKTETDTRRIGGFFSSREVAVARSLTYRVRPLREGVLWFPALEFEYADADGAVRTVVANEIPGHARPGEQVNVDAAFADCLGGFDALPEMPELMSDPGVALSDDALFAWRKACAEPSAAAFADFAFPAGRMNEAACAIREGQWRRALKIYSRLEWSVGQTPGIERGIIAALAVRSEDSRAELPVWRQVGRPLLRYGLVGRFLWIGGALLSLTLLLVLSGKLVRRLACLTVLLSASSASAQFSFFSNGFGEEEAPSVSVSASVRTDPQELQVGSPFAFVLSVEVPKNVGLGQIQLRPSEMYGMTVTGPVENLTDGIGANASNVVKRLSVPVRYDVPFKGSISFGVTVPVSGRVEKRTPHGHFVSSFTRPVDCTTAPIVLDVKPLPTDDQPADFSGIIAEDLRMTERTDLKSVGTNDVIQIVYHLECRGYLPASWRPDGVAFEIGRASRRDVVAVEWQRYFVADGSASTPTLSVTYYNPKKRSYQKLEAGGTHVNYQ